MYDLSTALDRLSKGNETDRLCARILKYATILEDENFPAVAAVGHTSYGLTVTYNPTLIDSSFMLEFALRHEALHIILGHPNINFNNYDMTKLNMALDASINPYLTTRPDILVPLKTFVDQQPEGKFLSGWMDIYERLTWENMYDLLLAYLYKENKQVQPQSGGDTKEDEDNNQRSSSSGDSDSKAGEETPPPGDSEGMEGSGGEDEEGEQSEGEEDASSDGEDSSDSTDSGSSSSSEMDDTGASEENRDNENSRDGDNGSGVSAQLAPSSPHQINYSSFDSHAEMFSGNVVDEEITENIVMQSMKEENISIGSALGQAIVKGMRIYKPPLARWKKALNTAVVSAIMVKDFSFSYLKANRRMRSSEFRFPGSKAEFYPNIGVVVDSSGSMSSWIQTVLDHVMAICTQGGELAFLVMGDVRVRWFKKHVTQKDVRNLEFKGLGGTKITPLIEKATSERPDILIVISDMEVWDEDVDAINKVGKKIKTIVCYPDQPYNNGAKLAKHIKKVPIEIDIK